MTKTTESIIQTHLMHYVMEGLNHQLVLPNTRSMYTWEADLVTMTKSHLAHEFEIKISFNDFKADKRKKKKHQLLASPFPSARIPSYFWYAINGFELMPHDVPGYAGLIYVDPTHVYQARRVRIIKPAPRLHTVKVPQKQFISIIRWLSFKLKNEYEKQYT
jgi:hypothetical protein